MGHHTWYLWQHLHSNIAYSIVVGWSRNYCVYSSSSVAIDSSWWQVLLVSLIPTHLRERRSSVIYTIFSVSLRTWITPLRIHECLQRKVAWLVVFPGCVCIIFCFWLSVQVNSLSSPVNGNSEWRWPAANVGVHPCISTSSSTSVFRWSAMKRILPYILRWIDGSDK